jgi:3'-5' exonuclease
MSTIPLHNILFLDIETASQYPSYLNMPAEWQGLWDHRSNSLLRNKEEETPETIYPKAAIYAEFGKVICISCGIIQGSGINRKIVIKSFVNEDEKLLLNDFSNMVQQWSFDEARWLCAHNGKDFDFPYLCRRMTVHRIPIPAALNCTGKKPWETRYLDTMELWKFGEYKCFTSLNLMAHTLGIQTPKDDIDGSKVGEVYWIEKNITRIVEYCQKDVVTVAQIFLRLQNEPPITAENIEIKV